ATPDFEIDILVGENFIDELGVARRAAALAVAAYDEIRWHLSLSGAGEKPRLECLSDLDPTAFWCSPEKSFVQFLSQ
ncbi:MAG: hypothetical protein WA196_12320, partial [Pseudolabrys sp.]